VSTIKSIILANRLRLLSNS